MEKLNLKLIQIIQFEISYLDFDKIEEHLVEKKIKLNILYVNKEKDILHFFLLIQYYYILIQK